MNRGRAALCAALFLAAPVMAEESWALPGDRAFVAVGRDHPGPGVLSARLSAPTTRYEHGVLGGIPMFSRLDVTARRCGTCPLTEAAIDLPNDLVFEDIAPRFWDVGGDDLPEIVLVEAQTQKGARLTVWTVSVDGLTRLAASDFIGRPQRWLAPAGSGDFDGDGQVEIAYVDQPHLARELVLVQLRGRKLVEVARVPGYSNHRIGDTTIRSGVRNCGAGDELVLPDATGKRLIAFRLDADPTDLGPFSKPALAAALSCQAP